MKKIFYLIFLITIFSKVHAYEYCDKSLKTLDPMGDKSPMTVILLVGELECLGKTKEAKEFKELTNENFKKKKQKVCRNIQKAHKRNGESVEQNL